jgi:photosystem II stability/assembly factor-like uncharacterized protein
VLKQDTIFKEDKEKCSGINWQINSHWTGSCGVPAVHADCHVLEFSNADGMLYAGNDGGIYRTSDGGNTWTEITSGIAISQGLQNRTGSH